MTRRPSSPPHGSTRSRLCHSPVVRPIISAWSLRSKVMGSMGHGVRLAMAMEGGMARVTHSQHRPQVFTQVKSWAGDKSSATTHYWLGFPSTWLDSRGTGLPGAVIGADLAVHLDIEPLSKSVRCTITRCGSCSLKPNQSTCVSIGPPLRDCHLELQRDRCTHTCGDRQRDTHRCIHT